MRAAIALLLVWVSVNFSFATAAGATTPAPASQAAAENTDQAAADKTAQIEEDDSKIADQAVTLTPDGIDIYPTVPTDDGENHYIHVSKNPNDPSRFVFQYCRDGLPVDMARQGVFPKNRQCYLVIGNNSGYTVGEFEAELQLMMEQAVSQRHSQEISSVGTGLVTGLIALVVVNMIEAPSGGTAEVLTDGAVAAGGEAAVVKIGTSLTARMAAIWAKPLIRKLVSLLATTVVSSISSYESSKFQAWATEKTNDSPFSSPSEMIYTADEVKDILSQGNVVVVKANMDAFASDLTAILGKIQ